MLAQRLAERRAGAGVLNGDGLRPRRRAQPAHAMGEPGRRQPHLRVAKRLADFAENRRGRQSEIAEPHHSMALDVIAVHGVHHPFELDTGCVAVAEEQGRPVAAVRVGCHPRHDDPGSGAVGTGDQPLAAVDHVLGAVEDCLSRQLAGSEPAPPGSVMANTDRCRPSITGTRNSSA